MLLDLKFEELILEFIWLSIIGWQESSDMARDIAQKIGCIGLLFCFVFNVESHLPVPVLPAICSGVCFLEVLSRPYSVKTLQTKCGSALRTLFLANKYIFCIWEAKIQIAAMCGPWEPLGSRTWTSSDIYPPKKKTQTKRISQTEA